MAYHDVVPSSFFGHHHTPSLRIVSNVDSDAKHSMYISPSLTPRNPSHNPAVRLYFFNRSTGVVLDFKEYSYDLSLANAKGSVNWSAEDALHRLPINASTLSAPMWQQVFRRMIEFDHAPTSTVELDPADPFLKWMSAERCKREVYIDSGDSRIPPLRRCKLAALCSILHLEDAPYSQCLGLR